MEDEERKRKYKEAWDRRNKKQRSEYAKLYYQEHREEILERCRNYHRQSCLSTTNGHKIHNLKKKPYTGYCEICKRVKPKFLHYHHWKEDPNIGMWICMNCHYMAEGIDKGLDVAYRSLRGVVFKK